MVIRGRSRGNGPQLARYLLFKGENDGIQILDVNGRLQPDGQHLHQALLSMSLTSELTKSEKGLYHAQINPAYGDDKRMTGESWLQAADMLGEELGLSEQRRVIVLHSKKGRTHAHVVWERYDFEKGRMVSDSFSRLAQDRARKNMERVFEQQATPHRNVKRPEMKEALSKLWQKAKTGMEFVQEAAKSGYQIAKGIQRRPFMIVDETGRSFDLMRQLDGVNTREVRKRLKGENLIAEKDAIALVRTRQQLREKQSQEAAKTVKKLNIAWEFAQNQNDQTAKVQTFEKRKQDAAQEFSNSLDNMVKSSAAPNKMTESTKTVQDSRTAAANLFADNAKEQLAQEQDKELKRQKFREALQQAPGRDKTKGLDLDI